MKIIATLLIAFTFTATFAGSGDGDAEKITDAELNEKFYEINKWGYAQFTYWTVTDKKSNRFGAKPISDKTLYIETSRAGIIDSDITWKEFSKLSVDDWNEMLVAGQADVIDAIENGVSPKEQDVIDIKVIKVL